MDSDESHAFGLCKNVKGRSDSNALRFYWRVTEDASRFSWMIRADLGKLTADAIYDPATVNKVYTAFDSTRDSFVGRFFERLGEPKSEQ